MTLGALRLWARVFATAFARLIAEGRARVASPEEAEDFRKGHRAARADYEQQEAARRIQVMVMPRPERKKRDRS